MRVAIVGGGIGGLTLALSLRARGIRADVYEQADEFGEVGAAVALSANGTRVLRGLGVGADLGECSAVPTELIYRNGFDGRRVQAFTVGDSYERRFGAPYYGIHRADLQRILVAACDQDRLHLGARVVGCTETAGEARLEFGDGGTANADVVVGADGVHSALREYVLGAETMHYSGTSGFRGLIPADRLPRLPDPGAIQFWMGPSGHLLHYPIGDGKQINFLAVRDEPASWQASDWVLPASPDEIAAAFECWHPAVVEMVTATSLYRRWALFAQQPSTQWYRGRLALLGDAVHAMLPHHGQGANQSIEDAATLATLLATTGDDEPLAALHRYQSIRRARARLIQRSSWVASDLLHLPDGPDADYRDSILARIDRTLDWIHSHDAVAAVR